MVLAVICVAAAIWLFGSGLHIANGVDPSTSSARPALAGAYFTAASLFAATSGWLLTNAVSLLAKTREKASDFIKIAQNDAAFLSALTYIGTVINFGDNKRLLDDSLARSAFHASPESERFRLSMRAAFNTFDEMAIFIRRGAADEAILRDFYDGMLIRFYEVYALFLPLIGNIPRLDHARDQRPEIQSNIDWLYSRWLKQYNDRYFHDLDRKRIELTGSDFNWIMPS